jgi:hypothetical protein
MAQDPAPPRPEGPTLEEVLAAYLEAEDAGCPPDRATLLAGHPGLAAELTHFFTSQDRLAPLLRRLGELGPVPDHR